MLNNIEVLTSKALINSYISNNEFVSVNNVLREYNAMKEEEKILKLPWNIIYKIQWKRIASNVKKYTANENSSARKSKQNRIIILSNCAVCGKKKSTFIKNKEHHNFD